MQTVENYLAGSGHSTDGARATGHKTSSVDHADKGDEFHGDDAPTARGTRD